MDRRLLKKTKSLHQIRRLEAKVCTACKKEKYMREFNYYGANNSRCSECTARRRLSSPIIVKTSCFTPDLYSIEETQA